MQSLRLLSASSASAAPVRVVLGRALFHTSAAPAGSFPSNQAKRRARRKFLQSQARKYDIKPTMSNDMIVRYLQDKGVMKANQFELEEWRHYQQFSSAAARKERHFARLQAAQEAADAQAAPEVVAVEAEKKAEL